MSVIYVDEKSHRALFGLGVFAVHDEVWRQKFIRLLSSYSPPLKYHATEDRQIDLGKFKEMKAQILETVADELLNPSVCEWRYFEKSSEKEAWKSFTDWAFQRFKPTRDKPVIVYRDAGNLRRETTAMLSGNNRFLIQAKPKVLAAETRVDPHKIMIGIVDYLLYVGKV